MPVCYQPIIGSRQAGIGYYAYRQPSAWGVNRHLGISLNRYDTVLPICGSMLIAAQQPPV
jgi:hypothetical protein